MFCSLHSKKDHATLFDVIKGEYADDITGAITGVGKAIITKTYCQDGESVADRLIHACVAFATDEEHAMTIADQISTGQFMFATPLLANAGTSRGLPISCFLNYVDDSLESIGELYAENIHLSAMGGGIGTHWSNVRSNGTNTSNGSQTTGVIPFMHVQDAQALAFNQGKTRRGAHAVYLDVSHPEIFEFLSTRVPEGDLNRKNLHLHQGVTVSDSFMLAVKGDEMWGLVDPYTGITVEVVRARHLWGAVLSARMSNRGEPYIVFSDTAENSSQYKDYNCWGSNLCTEIFLKTDKDTTAVCCLSSINFLRFAYLDAVERGQLCTSMVTMLDNALTVFTKEAPDTMIRAICSVYKERSIGIGVMGLHSYLQKDSDVSYALSLFDQIESFTTGASARLVSVFNRPIPVEAAHLNRRNTHITAIAPNSTSSLMLGVSPGIEPQRANIYTIKQGGVIAEVVNPHLYAVLSGYPDVDKLEVMTSIRSNGGSVQHLTWMTAEDKLTLRTAVEHDQMDQVKLVANIQSMIHQGISLNLFFKVGKPAWLINDIHIKAWEIGIKSLYYCRVAISDRVENVSTSQCSIDNKEECLACQG
jgi:ribonucleoside-diphosphate reductase alpha chain